MDESRFDQFAKQLVTQTGRRRVLQGVSGAAAAVLAAALGQQVTEAKRGKRSERHSVRKQAAGRCRTVGQACKTSEDCCPGPTRNGNVFCGATGRKQKACQTCPSATPTACNGGCVNTSNDVRNCGGCGEPCNPGESCCAGVCRNDEGRACPTNRACCDSTCSTSQVGHNLCCASGKACYLGSGDESECCASASDVCTGVGCCAANKACGVSCCGPTHFCNTATDRCDPLPL